MEATCPRCGSLIQADNPNDSYLVLAWHERFFCEDRRAPEIRASLLTMAVLLVSAPIAVSYAVARRLGEKYPRWLPWFR